MDARCRLLILQLICLVWPHVSVHSFVLHRRSTVDDDPPFSDALYAVQRPALSYVSDVDDRYDLLPQYVEDYGNYDDDDNALADNLINIIKEQEAAERDYEDFSDQDYDEDRWAAPLEADREKDYDSDSDNDVRQEDTVDYSPAKVPLDKTQLKQIFTDTNEQHPEHEVIKKTTEELSKNDVEKLFDSTATDENTQVDAELPDLTAPDIEIKLPAESSTDVDEIVKSIEEVKSSDDGDVVGDEVIDVKEETISPEDGRKLTKEWMMELVPTSGDKSSEWSASGSRKSKRSMDVQSEEDAEGRFEVAAKQRAVDLLKTYIELQAEENHHLTEALNLATLAQTQRTDRYIDDEVEELRQAVRDEAAIESLRDMIRADDDVQNEIDEQNDDEEAEEEGEGEDEKQKGDEDYEEDYYEPPAIDYLPVRRAQLSQVLAPSADNLLDDNDYNDDEDDDSEMYEKNAILRERLRRYLLKKELDSIRDEVGNGDYDNNVNDVLLRSELSPPFDNIYSGNIMRFIFIVIIL